jgi:hypothetical protein
MLGRRIIHTAKTLASEPSLVEVQIAIGNLKSYKSPGSNQIPGRIDQSRG